MRIQDDATIEEVERDLANRIEASTLLDGIVPRNLRVRVTLFNEKGRKKHRDASIRTWMPESDYMEIGFERVTSTSVAKRAPAARPGSGVDGNMERLILALDRVEHRPGYQFVALKWFRDSVMAPERISRETLNEAIDRRIVVTGRVPNPNDARYPVTSIRLDRGLPQVREVLAQVGARSGVFSPLPPTVIRGEPLSATVIRERR